MDVKQAIAAYAQSEKVKSGLIWICQISDQVGAVEGAAKKHGVSLVRSLARMVSGESDLAGKITDDPRWNEIGKMINMALVMIDSGVPQETTFHLTKALTRVTRIGGQAADILKENKLL
jgi:hypothetical protein